MNKQEKPSGGKTDKNEMWSKFIDILANPARGIFVAMDFFLASCANSSEFAGGNLKIHRPVIDSAWQDIKEKLEDCRIPTDDETSSAKKTQDFLKAWIEFINGYTKGDDPYQYYLNEIKEMNFSSTEKQEPGRTYLPLIITNGGNTYGRWPIFEVNVTGHGPLRNEFRKDDQSIRHQIRTVCDIFDKHCHVHENWDAHTTPYNDERLKKWTISKANPGVEGPSLGFPLMLAILSRISGRHVPMNVVTTGQFDIDWVACEVEIEEKIKHIREHLPWVDIFMLPEINKKEALNVCKKAELDAIPVELSEIADLRKLPAKSPLYIVPIKNHLELIVAFEGLTGCSIDWQKAFSDSISKKKIISTLDSLISKYSITLKENIDDSFIFEQIFHTMSSHLHLFLEDINKILEYLKSDFNNMDSGQALFLSNFVVFCLDKKSKFMSQDASSPMYIRAISFWLLANDHGGRFCTNAAVVKEAEKQAEYLLGRFDFNCLPYIFNFYNILSSSHQNIFDFETCDKCLLIAINKLNNIFNMRPKDYFIGALEGTYAINAFYYSHMKYLEGDINQYYEYQKRGFDHSNISKDFFLKAEDQDRRRIYEANAYMQEAMLINDSHTNESLFNKSIDLLNVSRDFQRTISDFLKKPDTYRSNDLYRITALLKLLWLKGENISKFISIDIDMERLTLLPAIHPHEQIIGYLALMLKDDCKWSKFATALAETLKKNTWQSELITTITSIFILQFDWSNNRDSIDGSRIASIIDRLDEESRINWQKYRLDAELAKMNKLEYKGRGPLTILPFNFA